MPTTASFPSASGLAFLFAISLFAIFTTAIGLYLVLVQIELQSTLSFSADANEVELNENENDNDTTQSKTDVKGSNDAGGDEDVSADVDGVARRMHLPMFRRGALAAVVSVIVFMNYLLLAVSNAPVLLSWIGMFTVMGLLLRQTIFDEIRRERFDRLSAILSLVLVLAMSINLAVYANRQHAQGDIYEGPARIVGYDYSSYTQEQDDTILRTDLEVSWGSWWGCPRTGQQCEAFVSGALCETKEEDGQRRLPLSGKLPQHHRRLADTNDGDAANNADGNGQEENNNAGNDQELEEQNTELQQENEALEEQNEELEEENEELQEELDEYEAYAEEEEEEIDDIYEEYYFEDDYYGADYWGGTEWDDVWGEYACEDLFAYDVEGESYDEQTPPGSDEWPFVSIYGNCNTCEAYIVDYYSTNHFQSILSYKTAGLWYGILAGLSMLTTWFLIFNQKNLANKSADKEIELLPTSEGAMA